MMSRKAALIQAYLDVKSDILAGARTVDDMTCEEQAGLYLKIGGLAALANYDAMPYTVRMRYEAKWPNVRKLIAAALAT